jgi:hypothetical protein
MWRRRVSQRALIGIRLTTTSYFRDVTEHQIQPISKFIRRNVLDADVVG